MGSVFLVNVAGALWEDAQRCFPALAQVEAELGDEASLGRVRPGFVDAVVLGTRGVDVAAATRRLHACDPAVCVVLVGPPQDLSGIPQPVRRIPEGDANALCVEVFHTLIETLRRRAQSASVREAAALREAPLGIAALDEGGNVVVWNRRAERLFERDAATVLSRPLSSVLPPSEWARLDSLLMRADALESPVRLEVERRRHSGQRQVIELMLAALHQPAHSSGMVLVMQDVTDRAATDTERTQLLLQTQRALTLRDQFLAAATHELRTPLTSLRLVVESLRRELEEGHAPPELRQSLERKIAGAERQAIRLSRLVEGLLDVSSIQSGRLRLERSVVNLAQVVERVVHELREHFERAGCQPKLSLQPVKGAWDERRLEQVVMNLVTNALRHAPGTPIEIEVRQEPGRAVIEVRDRGIGIEPQELERLFSRFERDAPPRNQGGLGLGLFISRKIVEAHDGTLSARSTPGEGALFRVELPTATP